MRLFPLVLLALAGCGTIDDLGNGRFGKVCFGPSPPPHVFGGVRLDAFTAGQAHTLGWIHYFDIPFSLVLDVVLLPISIPVALFSSPDDDQEIPK